MTGTLRADERGISTAEYVVLLVLIVASAAALWNVVGNLLVGKLAAAASEFDSEVVTSGQGTNELTPRVVDAGAIRSAAGEAVVEPRAD